MGHEVTGDSLWTTIIERLCNVRTHTQHEGDRVDDVFL